MERLSILFTRREFNPVSWAIRWALPMSRFKLAYASHCMIVDGEYVIEASMTHGVRRVLRDEALSGSIVVGSAAFAVANAAEGIAWARGQVGKPYDFKGAFGLALAPDRDWMEEDSWFCFELGAAALAKAGREIFETFGHVNGTMLMSVKPCIAGLS